MLTYIHTYIHTAPIIYKSPIIIITIIIVIITIITVIVKPVVSGTGDEVLGELEEGVEEVGSEVISAALGEKVGDYKEPATSYHLQNKGNQVEEQRESG